MEVLLQNKEFILLLGGIIGIIFYFKSLSKDFHSEINGLRAEMRAEISGLRTEVRTEINELRIEIRAEIQTVNDRIDKVNNRIDGLYNLFATQIKSK